MPNALCTSLAYDTFSAEVKIVQTCHTSMLASSATSNPTQPRKRPTLTYAKRKNKPYSLQSSSTTAPSLLKSALNAGAAEREQKQCAEWQKMLDHDASKLQLKQQNQLSNKSKTGTGLASENEASDVAPASCPLDSSIADGNLSGEREKAGRDAHVGFRCSVKLVKSPTKTSRARILRMKRGNSAGDAVNDSILHKSPPIPQSAPSSWPSSSPKPTAPDEGRIFSSYPSEPPEDMVRSGSAMSSVSTSPLRPRHRVGHQPLVKVTYNGAYRSFQESEQDALASCQAYKTISQRNKEEGLDSDSDDDEQGGKKAPIKSIHELRQSGEAKRQLDQFEYIMDGLLDASSPGVQRASCVELTQLLLLHPKLATNLRTANCLGKLVHCFTSSQLPWKDVVLQAGVALIMFFILQDARNALALAAEPGLVELLCRPFALVDPFDHRAKLAKISKYNASILNEWKTLFEKQPLLDKLVQWSLHEIAVCSLHAVIQTGQSASCRQTLLASVAPKLVDFVASHSQPNAGLLSSGGLLRCMELLEHASLGLSAKSLEDVFNEQFIETLSNVLCTLPTFDLESCHRLTLCTVRFFINLSNESLTLSSSIFTHLSTFILNAILTDLPQNVCSTFASDLMLLCMGLLINILETCPRLRSTMCQLALPQSKTQETRPVLPSLVTLFNARLAAERQYTEHNICSAYLALLLGVIVKDMPQARLIVLRHLANASFDETIQLLEEFAVFHRVLVEGDGGSRGPDDGRGPGSDIARQYGAHRVAAHVAAIVNVLKCE